MKKIHLTTISGLALAAMFVLTAAQVPASGQNGKGRRIEGTWRLEVTDRDCQTGVAIFTGPALHTYLAGGSMLSDPAVSPAILRTGHGVWEHAGGLGFTNTIVLFRFNLVNGAYAGTVTIRRNIELSENSDEFTSTDTAEAADPNGNVTGTRCATTVGRRLE
jgi:hypothetical protein